MTREKVINYIDSLIQQAHESDRFFTERNRLYVENQELKKQLEETIEFYTEENALRHEIDLKLDIVKTQQKEFIKYLEDEIEKNRKEATCMVAYNNSVLPLKEILSKYKEIVGDE